MAKRLDKSKMKCNKPKSTPDHPTKSHVVKALAVEALVDKWLSVSTSRR
jgi:hypothetical protein